MEGWGSQGLWLCQGMVYYALGKTFFTLIHVVPPFSKGIKFLNFPFGEIAIKKAL